MKLYEECFTAAAQFEGGTSLTPAPGWPDAGKNQLIFQSDTACELGGGRLSAVSALALTDSAEHVPADEILLIGPDLSRLRGEVPYARLALLRVNEEAMGDGKAFYQNVRKIEYTRYHVSPEGFMLRISPMNHRESVRVSRKALEQGLSFAHVGEQFIRAYHEHPAVEAVKLIFVTDPAFPFAGAERIAERAEGVTKALDHLLQKVKMDCNVCSLKDICAEVEELCKSDFPASPN